MRIWACTLVLVLPTLGWSQTEAEKKATIAYLQSLQTNIGGFLSMQPQPNIRLAPTLRATSAGIRALKYWGGEVPNPDGAKKFVLDCFDAETGGFGERKANPPEVFITATGLMAAAELKLPLDEYRKQSVKYLAKEVMNFEDMRIAVAGLEALGEAKTLLDADTLKKWRALLPDIGKGNDIRTEARLVGSTVVAKYRLGEELASADEVRAVITALQKDQRADGGFAFPDQKASDMETTYRVMRCFARFKAKPTNVDELRKFIASCRNADGGYGTKPGETSTVGATYYAGIILYWLNEKN